MWAGDQSSDWDKGDGFPTVIIGGIALRMCGVPFYGHDVGGYTDTTSAPLTLELFIRWSQFGALSPIMQIYSMRNITPWSFGDDGVRLYREFAKLHTQLVPYTYTMAKIANSTGMPIIRHPFLVHPEDPRTSSDSFSYYYGNSFFVAPFYEPGGERAIYFPEGENYIDWFTGELYEGGTSIGYSCDLERMPLFVLEGSIIPMFHPDVDTLAPVSVEIGVEEIVTADLDPDLLVRMYPKSGKVDGFTLYDGARITSYAEGGELDILVRAKRGIDFEVFGEYDVTVNGRRIEVRIANGKTFFTWDGEIEQPYPEDLSIGSPLSSLTLSPASIPSKWLKTLNDASSHNIDVGAVSDSVWGRFSIFKLRLLLPLASRSLNRLRFRWKYCIRDRSPL